MGGGVSRQLSAAGVAHDEAAVAAADARPAEVLARADVAETAAAFGVQDVAGARRALEAACACFYCAGGAAAGEGQGERPRCGDCGHDASYCRCNSAGELGPCCHRCAEAECVCPPLQPFELQGAVAQLHAFMSSSEFSRPIDAFNSRYCGFFAAYQPGAAHENPSVHRLRGVFQRRRELFERLMDEAMRQYHIPMTRVVDGLQQLLHEAEGDEERLPELTRKVLRCFEEYDSFESFAEQMIKHRGASYRYGEVVPFDEDVYHEFKDVQREQTAGKRLRNLRKTIVKYALGFANSGGGTLYLGVTDAKVVVGIVLSTGERDKLERMVTQFVRGNVAPQLPDSVLRLEFVPVVGEGAPRMAFVVEVVVRPWACEVAFPSQLFRDTTVSQVYRRSGPSTNELTEAEQAALDGRREQPPRRDNMDARSELGVVDMPPDWCVRCEVEGHCALSCAGGAQQESRESQRTSEAGAECQNCAQPGHATAACAQPCSQCGLGNHRKPECRGHCKNCDRFGHLEDKCSRSCGRCRLEGHTRSACETRCDKCNRLGHTAEACRGKKRRSPRRRRSPSASASPSPGSPASPGSPGSPRQSASPGEEVSAAAEVSEDSERRTPGE